MRQLLVIIMLITVLFSVPKVLAHENEEYKHKSLPPCHGWEIINSGQRRCFINRERTMCVNAIYNHGIWHISEPYECGAKK